MKKLRPQNPDISSLLNISYGDLNILVLRNDSTNMRATNRMKMMVHKALQTITPWRSQKDRKRAAESTLKTEKNITRMSEGLTEYWSSIYETHSAANVALMLRIPAGKDAFVRSTLDLA